MVPSPALLSILVSLGEFLLLLVSTQLPDTDTPTQDLFRGAGLVNCVGLTVDTDLLTLAVDSLLTGMEFILGARLPFNFRILSKST